MNVKEWEKHSRLEESGLREFEPELLVDIPQHTSRCPRGIVFSRVARVNIKCVCHIFCQNRLVRGGHLALAKAVQQVRICPSSAMCTSCNQPKVLPEELSGVDMTSVLYSKKPRLIFVQQNYVCKNLTSLLQPYSCEAEWPLRRWADCSYNPENCAYT